MVLRLGPGAFVSTDDEQFREKVGDFIAELLDSGIPTDDKRIGMMLVAFTLAALRKLPDPDLEMVLHEAGRVAESLNDLVRRMDS